MKIHPRIREVLEYYGFFGDDEGRKITDKDALQFLKRLYKKIPKNQRNLDGVENAIVRYMKKKEVEAFRDLGKNPKSYHNIEKSGFHRGQYVGYGGGMVFKIRKWGTGWEAFDPDFKYQLKAKTMSEMSAKLDSLGSLRTNPPFYAHHLYEKKTHGLSLKQMKRLYRMVSAGNQKAITFARNVLGIPFSETATQVKAVVLHHVRDLMGGRVRRNPADDITPVVFRTFRSGGDVIALFPYEPGTNDPSTMMSYQHIGQHGPADAGLVAVHTRPSTPDEVRPLRNELERIGYKLKILKRIPGDAGRVRMEKLGRIK